MTTPQPGQQPPPPYGYPAPPPPPGKSNTGKIIGFGCGGLVLLSLLLFGCGAAVLAGSKGGAPDVRTPAFPAPIAPTAPAAPSGAPAQSGPPPAPAPDTTADVVVTASPAAYKAGILAQGGDHTSVQVTVINNNAEEVDVNVFYFEVTTEDGTRKQIELAAAEDQIDTVKLAKGEKASGTITVKGKVTAKTVHFKNGLLGKTYSAPVK